MKATFRLLFKSSFFIGGDLGDGASENLQAAPPRLSTNRHRPPVQIYPHKKITPHTAADASVESSNASKNEYRGKG
jgi:hypothetical protein